MEPIVSKDYLILCSVTEVPLKAYKLFITLNPYLFKYTIV